MAIPVNIEDLLHKRKIESARIEFKKGWNPDKISILSFTGPDRSISLDAIQKAERLKSRRYRNRRLGDYLKELQLSEGRGTGIPTIQDELRRNGSAPAVIETNEERSYFLIEIPCHEGFGETLHIGDDVVEPLNEPLNEKELLVLNSIANGNVLNRTQIVAYTNISESSIKRIIRCLSAEPLKLIERQGSKKNRWLCADRERPGFCQIIE